MRKMALDPATLAADRVIWAASELWVRCRTYRAITAAGQVVRYRVPAHNRHRTVIR